MDDKVGFSAVEQGVDSRSAQKKAMILRSEEVSEILGTPPRAIIRYGITAIGAVILMVVVGSAFIKYPDIVSTPISITTQQPPEPIVSRVTGKPMAIMVEDRQLVEANQTVAIMQNAARYADVQLVKSTVSSAVDEKSMQSLSLPSNVQLGELQDAYGNMVKALAALHLFDSQQYYQRKEQAMVKQVSGYSEYSAKVKAQMSVTAQDYELALKQHLRDSLLLAQKVISPSDFEHSKSAMLVKRGSVMQQSIQSTNAMIEQAKLEQSLVELRMEAQSRRAELVQALVASFNLLKSGIAQWDEKYILRSHNAGRISFLKVWSTSQEVKAGETMFTVVPLHAGKVVGIATIGKGSIGKVAEGQSVSIKLSGYPSQEYGVLKGVVRAISLAPGDSLYAAIVSVPQSLETSYRRKIRLRGELTGVAEISTEEISVLARVWAPLKYLVSKQKM